MKGEMRKKNETQRNRLCTRNPSRQRNFQSLLVLYGGEKEKNDE